MNADTFKQQILLKNSEVHLDSVSDVSDADVSQFKQQIRDLLDGVLPLKENYLVDLDGEDSSAPFALSDIQYAYVIGRNPGVELGGRSSSLYMEMDIEGGDLQALSDSLNYVIKLHPMLRATIVDDGKQKVLDNIEPYTIEALDIRDLSQSEKDEILVGKRREMEEALLPLDKAPSFNIKAVLMSSDVVRLNLFFDLTFVDMHSVHIVLRDWFLHYREGSPNESLKRPKFSDYLKREELFIAEGQGRQDRSYWEKKLDKLPPSPELPLKKSPSLLSNPKLSHSSRSISIDLVSKLREIASEKGLTLEALFLGSYIEVIRQWSKTQSFTITVTQMSRRPYFEGIGNTVGNFLQPVLFAVTDAETYSFEDRLIQTQSNFLVNRLHSSHNSIKILRELTKRNQANRSVSFPVVFSNTLDFDLRDVVKGVASKGINHVYSSNKTPQLWLENQITSHRDSIFVNWNYVDDLFPDHMIEVMLDSYIDLLTACSHGNAIFKRKGSVVSLPRADLISRTEANNTKVDLQPVLLHELVQRSASKSPGHIALVQGDYEVTNRELLARAEWLARHIQNTVKVRPNEIIAVSQLQGPDLVIAILGVLMSGAAYVAIDPNLPKARKIKLIERCSAKGVVGNAHTLSDFDEFSDISRFNLLDYSDKNSGSETAPLQSIQNLDDLAYVIFTSGSTGEPKGVMISHRNASNTVIDINRRFNVTKDDAVLSVAPAGFDLSVYDYFGVLGAGGRVVFGKPDSTHDPVAWYQDLIDKGVTIWNSVPAPMKALVDKNAFSLGSTQLRLVLMSGDWIPVDLPGRIKEILPRCEVISLGGATEGSIWSIFYRIQEIDEKWSSVPYGKPLANQRFHVLNEWLSHCPKWVTGELYISGDGVAQGYMGDPEKTAQRFFKHPETGEKLYKTGDLGKYIEGGYIEILGREDNQVKINGYRVELGEVEVCLLMHDEVGHVVVGAPTHPKTGQRHIVAWIVSKGVESDTKSEELQEELKRLAQSELPNYMFPSYYILVPSMPLTSNGKINHGELPSPWMNIDNEAGNSIDPSNDVEALLLEIWKKQLQHDDMDVSSGFFDIGGDSLHAVALIGTIREHFGISPEAEQGIVEGLFMNSNIQYFSQIIQKYQSEEKTE